MGYSITVKPVLHGRVQVRTVNTARVRYHSGALRAITHAANSLQLGEHLHTESAVYFTLDTFREPLRAHGRGVRAGHHAQIGSHSVSNFRGSSPKRRASSAKEIDIGRVRPIRIHRAVSELGSDVLVDGRRERSF